MLDTIRTLTLLWAALLCAPLASQAADKAFPLRAQFDELQYISLEQALSMHDKAVVIDVRTPFEYQILHIKGAINIDVSQHDFVAHIEEVRAKNPGKAIIFYCNGPTCHKSYNAGRKSFLAKINKVHVMDAGVLAWARTYGNKTVLMGKSPIDVSHIIPDKRYESKFISADDFALKAFSGKTIVFDVRNSIERKIALFPGIDRIIDMDSQKALRKTIAQAAKSGKELLVYDHSGNDVRWVQYLLEDIGVKRYYFLEGGAKKFF